MAGTQYEEAEKHVIHVVAYLVPWKTPISGSVISARLYSIKLAHCKQGTWKMSMCQEGKGQISLRETFGFLC